MMFASDREREPLVDVFAVVESSVWKASERIKLEVDELSLSIGSAASDATISMQAATASF